MSNSEKTARVVLLLVLCGASLALPGSGLSFDFWGELFGLTVATVILGGAVWFDRRQKTQMAAASLPQNPAFGLLAPIDTLLTSDAHLWPLRGKVRELRTYSIPRSITEDGMMTPSYYSVIIDINGEVHDLEQGGSFGAIEQRAERLAQRLAVPFVSGI